MHGRGGLLASQRAQCPAIQMFGIRCEQVLIYASGLPARLRFDQESEGLEARMNNNILQGALALPAGERCELARRTRDALVAGEPSGEPGECPRRGCLHVVRGGYDLDSA